MLTRVQTQWLRLGLFQSIRPTIKYQPGKAHVVADALSRSQSKLEEGSMDDTAIEAVMIERYVSTLNGVSIEMTIEDLQTWTTAYKEDKGQVAAYMKLRQGQKYEDFYLTPSGLMARMMGRHHWCNIWIHLVFHVSNLKRFQRSKEFEREERQPSPVVVDGEEEYEAEAILRHKGKEPGACI